MGFGLTRLCMRHRHIEDRIKALMRYNNFHWPKHALIFMTFFTFYVVYLVGCFSLARCLHVLVLLLLIIIQRDLLMLIYICMYGILFLFIYIYNDFLDTGCFLRKLWLFVCYSSQTVFSYFLFHIIFS